MGDKLMESFLKAKYISDNSSCDEVWHTISTKEKWRARLRFCLFLYFLVSKIVQKRRENRRDT